VKEARLSRGGRRVLGGLNAFFLLLDKPSTYNLPEKPLLPQRNVLVDSVLAVGAALLVGVGAVVAFRERGGKEDGHA
jgi:formate dehydrogenase iron-sulfur subunit